MKNIKLLFFIIFLLFFLNILLCTFSYAAIYIVKDQEGNNISFTNHKDCFYEYINSGYVVFIVTSCGLSQVSFESILNNQQSQPKSGVIVSEAQTKTTLSPSIETTPVSAPKTIANREKIIDILKKNAIAEWGNNSEMVNYEVKNQTEAYDWVVKQIKYPDIMKTAKQKWGNNYKMAKYEYGNQLKAYEWLNQQKTYSEIMKMASNEWDNNYEMVKYEYENKVEAYKWLENNKNKNPEAYKRACEQWGNNYEMIKYEYEKEI